MPNPSVSYSTPWGAAMRDAFAVPAIIRERNVVEVIARQMVDLLPPHLPAAPPGEPSRSWAETTFTPALNLVSAFVQALSEGELDLAICGFGTVTGPSPGVPQETSSPVDDTMATLQRRLGGQRPNPEWVKWLYEQLRFFVSNLPPQGSPPQAS